MNAVGIVVEYNPFHNGHLYHLNEVKKRYPNSVIIAIMSGNFVQRGQVSLVSKWDKTAMALNFGVDLVLDLPFVFANEAADHFAMHSLKILNDFKVSTLVFGCETEDKDRYYRLAKIQLFNKNYNQFVKQKMDEGMNYPTACSKALEAIGETEVNLPNDILGLAYTKVIIANDYSIEIDLVKRTNDFHSIEIQNVSSATSIRNAILKNKDYKISVPNYTYSILQNTIITTNDSFYSFLKYKIIQSSVEDLRKIHLVDEGLEFKIKRSVLKTENFDELVKDIASKRYTHARVSRILFNILLNYTKQEKLKVRMLKYNRVLGFSECGQEYLRFLKKQNVDFTCNFKNINNVVADIEHRASLIVALVNKKYLENKKVVKNNKNL